MELKCNTIHDERNETIENELKDMIKTLRSSSSQEATLGKINKIIKSVFIQNVIYNYLQLSLYKDRLEIEDEGDENNNTEKWSEKSIEILKLTIELLAIICERTPSNIEQLGHLIDRIELVLEALNDGLLTDEFHRTVYSIKEDFLLRKNVNKKTEKIVSTNFVPPEDFRELPIVPRLGEITSSKGLFLLPNLKSGPFESVEHYLDIHFRLLREDYVGSLRDGIMEYMAINDIEKKKNQKPLSNLMNIRVYKNVKIERYITDNQGIFHEIKFELTNRLKTIRWETSKRLIQGSLLCFTNDNFKSAYFAVVHDRDIKSLKKGKTLVKFEDWISINNTFFCGNQQIKFSFQEIYYLFAKRNN